MLKKRIIVISVVLVACVVGQVFLRPGMCRAGEGPATKAESDQSDQPQEQLRTWSLDGMGLDKDKYETQDKLMRQFVLAICLVVLLGGCAWYVTKKFGTRLAMTRGKDISVVETVHLGPHKTLHLVEVGGRQKLLIGSTNENISMLADVTKAMSGELNEEVI
jgi:flagellar biosynthetic protein FliO